MARRSARGAALPYKPFEPEQDVGEGKGERCGIRRDYRSRTQQFSPVIPIACIAKGPKPLMGMGLSYGRPRSHDFSTLASLIPGSTDLIKAAMRGWQLRRLRKRTLPGYLSGSIDIHHSPVASLSVPHAPRWRTKRRSCHQIFLKERSQRLHRGLIKGCKKAREGRRVRQVCSAKKRHERPCKRSNSL